MSTTSNRHLSRSALEEYLALTAPAAIVVPGEPTCRISIDPVHGEISLGVPSSGGALDLTEFENVESRLVIDDGRRWCEVSLSYHQHPHEAYLLLCDVADLVQERALGLEDAVRSALSTFEELIARHSSLSAERQLGLYGELLFLEHCLKLADEPVSTVDFWKGFAPHEHDFVFAHACFEIKTTRSEKRRHQIGGLEQLQPLPGVPLWLVSIQLTDSTRHGGRTLSSLVADIRTMAGALRAEVEASLARAGWRDRDSSLYGDSLALRTVPSAYPVDDQFPALTRAAVADACPRPELIIDAGYRLDITSLVPGSPPDPATGFVQGGSTR